MFYFKQFKSLMSAIMDIDPDAQLITDTIIKFTIPGGTSAVAQYVHHDFDEEGDSAGSVVLMYDGNQTEFDSLRYAEDGIEGLVRQYEAKSGQTEPDGSVEPDDEPELDIATASVDELSSDLVKYLYDNFEEASYIGEKELSDGSLALRIDWGKPDNKKAAANALKDKYGDRIAFINTRAEYAPELDSSGILVYPPKSLQEAADNPADQFELVEDFPIWAIEPMVDDEWGSFLQYNGEELAKQDFYDIDNFMKSNGYCGIHAPSTEMYDQTFSGFTSRPAFGKGTSTCSVYAVKGEWYPLVQRFGLETSNAVNEADDGSMNEMNGDFESTGFGSSIRALCEKARNPALAESIIKLHKAYNESIDFDNEFGDYYSDLRKEEDEQDAEAENYQEMTEEGVQGVLNKLGLTVVNKWYDGNRSRPVFDCQKGNGETICVWTEPPYEAKVWFKNREPGNNRFAEDIITLDSLEYELNNLLDEISPTEEELNADIERSVGNSIDTAMMDHYDMMNGDIGDFESTGFGFSIKALCEKAGKPALAEAVMKLYAVCKPVTEAVDVPMQIFRDYCKKHDIEKLDDATLEDIVYTLVKTKRLTEDEGNDVYEQVAKTLPNKLLGSYKETWKVESVEDLPSDDWRDEYGEQGIIMNESSADGFFAKPNDPIGFAILNNDVASLQKLHDGTYVADEPYNVTGFSEDFDNEGEFHYDFEEGYHREFEEDWERVVGETDNQEALRLMLQYVPDFWLCSIDFWNAFKAGYDKKLLARLLSNYPAKDDPYNNYLPWEDVSFDEVMDFLEN